MAKKSKNLNAFAAFAKRVKIGGLEAVQHTPWHWQVRGGRFTVNYYPTTTTIYVNGTHSAPGYQRRGTQAEAVRAANELPPKRPRQYRAERPSRSAAATLRRRLLKKRPYCMWCNQEVGRMAKKATLEHVIPLVRGGSNSMDNLRLACEECNLRRGNDMPELVGGSPADKEG